MEVFDRHAGGNTARTEEASLHSFASKRRVSLTCLHKYTPRNESDNAHLTAADIRGENSHTAIQLSMALRHTLH